ncbi:nitroreductase family protein [Eubacteriales bacterium OttesenSCG-928-M02]|nr:nitroreductase family protein [Eubacteriales bacterium OttesenSCG-928-M02]
MGKHKELIAVNVIDVVKARRSIREYQPGDIGEENLADLLEAARLAPSWKNGQCFTYILVDNRETILQLGEINTNNPSQSAYQNAEYFIILCADPTQSGRREGKEYYMTDAAISMQQMMLVAADKGIGMCWIGAFYESPIKKLLNIPEDIRVVALSPIGLPDETPAERPRRDVNEMVFRNRYGNLL